MSSLVGTGGGGNNVVDNATTLAAELYTILQSPTDFSVATYLNTALQEYITGDEDEPGDDEKIQQKMAELVLQLQFMTQSCHEEIGKIGIELQAILPRCAADIGRVSIGVNGLQMDAEQLLYEMTGHSSATAKKKGITTKSLQDGGTTTTSTHDEGKVSGADDDNNEDDDDVPLYSSIETLSTLHALQTNLTRTKEILTAAATWDATVESIAPLLSAAAAATPGGAPTTPTSSGGNTNALGQAVQCYLQLEHGEQALRGMPNPEERQESVRKVRNQISSLLQPQLKHALAAMTNTSSASSSSSVVVAGSTNTASSSSSIASLQHCVQLYAQLNQLDLVKNEYIKHRPVVNGIHKLWFEYKPPITTSTTETTTSNNDGNLNEWLPQWFDVVLSLISEERRYSTSIFGTSTTSSKHQTQHSEDPNLVIVPEIIIKVLAECFRPILPSFKSRLESIYPSSPNSVHTGRGSLRDISDIYESMLRFLSVVYETITTGWVDMVESGLITLGNGKGANSDSPIVVPNNAPILYQELSKVFVQIMSPFEQYQKNLFHLESKYLQSQTKDIIQQLQSIVKSVSSASPNEEEKGWEVLQTTAMDELLEMANKIIPVSEGAIARFELLNGGYNVTATVQTIDQLLAKYASELAGAVHSVSASLVNVDGTVKSITFDESHVVCSLNVLKLAGTYNGTIQVLQNKTHERFQLLAERMSSATSREKELDDAFKKLSIGKSASFQLPETLSVVEINSILTKTLFNEDIASTTEDAATTSSFVVLQNFLKTDKATSPLYPIALLSSLQLATSCHTFVFDVCFAVPRYHLNGMSAMPTWKESKSLLEGWGGTSSSGAGSYGILPQAFITQIGEHMLALVQALEPFAADRAALELCNPIMDIQFVRKVSYQFWNDFIVAATGATATEELVKALMDGKDLIEFVVGVIPVEDESNREEDDGGESNEDAASTAFCNKWLDVVGLAVAGRILERIMRIPSLTPKGCEHLNADLGYIVNVFSALGIAGHPHPLLGHIAELCILDKEIIAERSNNLDRNNPASDFLRSVEERLSAMRGLNI